MLVPHVYGAMELEEDQRAALRAGSKQVRRVAAILRSVNPESFKAAEQAKWICEQAWCCKTNEPTVEDVVNGFADLLRYLPTLGPGTQETIQCALERLIERMGLSCEVYRALKISTVTDRDGRSR